MSESSDNQQGYVSAIDRFLHASCRWVASLPVKFVQFWTKPVRAEPLALFRIVIGVSMLGSALTSIAPDLYLYWSPDGIAPNDFYHDYVFWADRYSVLYFVDNNAQLTFVFVAWLIALVCVIVGYKTRLAAIVSFVVAWSFSHRHIYVLNGGDDVGMQALFYLMLAPAGAVWSLDAWQKKRRLDRSVPSGEGWIDWQYWRGQQTLVDNHVYIAPWPVRLMQIQICCIYFFTGLSKLEPSVWDAIVNWDISQTKNDYVHGNTVYWVLNDITLTRWSYASLPVPMWLCRIATWGTIAFELGFPFLVLFRRVRPWVLAVGVALHLSIFLTMEIGWFSQFTVCYYAVFLSAAGAIRFRNLAGFGRKRKEPQPATLTVAEV